MRVLVLRDSDGVPLRAGAGQEGALEAGRPARGVLGGEQPAAAARVHEQSAAALHPVPRCAPPHLALAHPLSDRRPLPPIPPALLSLLSFSSPSTPLLLCSQSSFLDIMCIQITALLPPCTHPLFIAHSSHLDVRCSGHAPRAVPLSPSSC